MITIAFADKVPEKSTDCPQFHDMLRFILHGDHLYIHSMDRLARNLVDLRQMVSDGLPSEDPFCERGLDLQW